MAKKTLTAGFHQDKRGSIYVNKIKGKEFIVSYTRAGCYRGGDYHSSRQYNLILNGKLEITTRKNNKDVVKVYGVNELAVIAANIPHLFKAVSDVISVEWRSGIYKPRYYRPYRKIISDSLRKK